MERIAHRGLWGAGRPENSLAAFDAAAALGLGVELDVHLSQDGVPVVFHDASLTRMTGAAGFVFERSAAALGKLGLLGGDGQSIPTLEAVLDLMPDTLPVLVEVKPPHADSPFDASQTARIALETVTSRPSSAAYCMSFSQQMTAEFMQALPPERVGFLAAEGDLEPVRQAARQGAGFAAIWRGDCASARSTLGRNGPKLLTWTINSPAQEAAAAPYVDGVIFEAYTP